MSVLRFVLLPLTAVTLFALGAGAFAAEESLDLDSATAITAPAPSSAGKSSLSDRVKLMGRVDLSYEVSPMDSFENIPKNDSFGNNHFFVFLKANISPEVSFLGEIVSQKFYSIDYQPSANLKFHFGKILVPFGDNSRYHYTYGGVEGRAILFPTIWAELGANIEWHLGSLTLDTYTVNGISSSTPATDPTFSGLADTGTQAVGVRLRGPLTSKSRAIGSVYFDRWHPGRNLVILGLNAIVDYGLIDAFFLRDLRLSTGLAYSVIEQGRYGTYGKYADYIELATQVFGKAEPRVRYGTYVDNNQNRGAADKQGLSLGINIPVSALNLLAEYQWNFEGANEVENDLLRLMISADF